MPVADALARLPRPMRRIALKALTVGALLAVAGCGGEDSGSPLGNALGYLPADAPFAVAIQTDVEGDQAKAVQKIADRFPFADQLKEGLQGSLSEEDLDFEKDVKPALGNEFVVGATDVKSFLSDDSENFVGAIQAKDEGALDKLVEKDRPKEVGEKDGATLYESSDGDIFAVDGDVLVVADSRRTLEGALEQHGADDALSEDALDEATEGLPPDAALRAFFNVEELLAQDPETRDARKVEWVSALQVFGLAASFEDDRVNLDFRLTSGGAELSAEDLPLAPGADSPAVIESEGEVGAGLRDPQQILDFAEAAGQSVDPAGFGDYNTGKETIERRLGLSLEEDVFGQLEDDVSVTLALDGTFGVRGKVRDPAAFNRTLAKLGRELPKLAEGAVGEPIGYARPKRGEDFYALATADGDSVVYGVVDGVFVLANSAERAGRLSREETGQVEGAEGAVALRADAEQLAGQALRRFGGASGLGGAIGGSLFTAPLGELTGSLRAEPDALTGKLELGFD